MANDCGIMKYDWNDTWVRARISIRRLEVDMNSRIKIYSMTCGISRESCRN